MQDLWTRLQQENKPFMALAPLDGVTDFVFREIVAETAKPDVIFTEFTHTDALLSKGYEKTVHRLKYSEKQHPIVAQIWGTRPESYKKVAAMVRELGFDGVDINMGCPQRNVMKSGGGAALIAKYELVDDIISATKEGAQNMPVSLKTRIGTNKIITEEWIGFLAKQNLAAITIHGRTAAEMSKVDAHWDEIAKGVKIIKQISPNTIVMGNGDVVDYTHAKKLQKESGIDGAMIGRGIFANPWVFEKETKEHSAKEHLELMLKHTKLYCAIYPEKRKFDAMKKFFKIYVKSFKGSNKLKMQLMATKDYSEVEQIISPYLDRDL